MRNDQELLSDWALGADESAFRALVGRYAGLVHGVAMRRTGGQGALAQEIGQNVFTMLARKAGSLRGHSSLASWLHRAAVLESAHLIRRESLHARKIARLAYHLETMSPLHDPPDAEPPGPEIDNALARLPEGDRGILLMRFFEDLSYKEIAAISGQNEAAARKRVERALTRLAPHLGKGGAASAAAAGLVSNPLQAALAHAAPEGFAATAGTAALAGASSLTTAQILFHSLNIMTLGKSAFLTTAVVLALITFGGTYTAASRISRSEPANAGASSAGDSASREVAALTASSRGGNPAKVTVGNPGDSPAKAALRERLRLIGRSMSVDLKARQIQFSGFGLPSGDAMRAMGEFDVAQLEDAWKMLGDFRGNPKEFKSVAAFLTSLRLEQDPPREILKDLLEPDVRIDGKPSSFAVHQVLGAWFKQEPSAAWDWLQQAVPRGDFPSDRRFNYGADLAGAWLKREPAAALAAMEKAGPEWTAFRQAVFVEALQDPKGRENVWPVLEKADDRTALMISDSHLQESEWTRDTVLPWLLTRAWTDGTPVERILHGWTWQDGELHEPGFGMLCESVGRLPDAGANAALLQSVRTVFDGITPEARPALLEKLVKDPAGREALTAMLAP